MAIFTCGRDCPREVYKGCTDSVVTYEGCVLAEWENNGYNDSDFVAAVWDETLNDNSGGVKTVMYASTRGWTYHNGASVDATDDVKAKAAKWYAEQAYKRAVWYAEDERVNPTVGKTVRSLTTRGKNKNVVGTVVARERNPYETFYKNGYKDPDSIYYQRVSVQVWGEWNPDTETVTEYETGDSRMRMAWLAGDRVEVINANPIDYEEIRRMSHYFIDNPDDCNYMAVFSRYWLT